MNYDIEIFEAINGLAEKSEILDFVGVFFAEYLAYILFLFSLFILSSD